jgi:septal ring factor EnvC (AmiA/AmiB activator)
LENLKFENGLEKTHIDILMLKLREKEEINKELEAEVNEMNEYVIALNKKIKESEEKTAELEKEIGNSKSNK